MTQIIKDIERAAEALHRGAVVAIPTETVYGLAGSIYSDEAIKKIYEVKQRPYSSPLIAHIPNIDVLSELCSDIPQVAYDLAEALWPGPLTLVLRKQKSVSGLFTSGNDTIAVRMPAHKLTLELLQYLGEPLAAPSANPFGQVSPTTAAHVYQYFKGQIPYILNGGPCTVGIESTIIGFEEGRPILYRRGCADERIISKIVGKPNEMLLSDGKSKAPGMLLRHYSPRTSLRLCEANEISVTLSEHAHLKTGLITFSRAVAHPDVTNIVLSPEHCLEKAAAGLYAALHELDNKGLDIIIAEKFENEGIGMALNDRLIRAAASHRDVKQNTSGVAEFIS